MTESPTQHRHLVPGPSSLCEKSSRGSPTEERRGSADATKKRVSMACTACKRSKRKCSGEQPCDNCRAFSRVCIFDETLDQRRRVAARRTAEELNYHRDLYNDLLKILRTDDRSHADRLLDMIRGEATNDELRSQIDVTLRLIEGGREGSAEAIHRLENIKSTMNEVPTQSWRRPVMAIDFMCGDIPFRVPALPWTAITTSSEFVSHLVSLYFTWDYPTHIFLDRDVFLKHMNIGDTSSPVCSPFLVNALLANACYFLDERESYPNLADDFLAEAERLKDNDLAIDTLAYLQGILLLHEIYALSGKNDLGYEMLHQAIQTGETLGLIGEKTPDVSHDEDMETSRRCTAWGLFHMDILAHTNFLRATLVDQVNLPRPNNHDQTREWWPYPKVSGIGAQEANFDKYFDEWCNLCGIAKKLSQCLFPIDNEKLSADQQNKIKEELYRELRLWGERLPVTFSVGSNPPPYILTLNMRYHTMVILLFLYHAEDEIVGAPIEGLKTPVSPTSPDTFPDYYMKRNVVQAAARAIAVLVRKQKQLYGMHHAHQFAVYAINLALFVLMEQYGAFDILDRDFLDLASAYSSIASRSQLGRNMFHLFRNMVRSRCQGARLRSSAAVSDYTKRLFDEERTSPSEVDWYADGLEKLQHKQYRSRVGEHSLSDMLDKYETLSLGKDNFAQAA